MSFEEPPPGTSLAFDNNVFTIGEIGTNMFWMQSLNTSRNSNYHQR